MNFLLCKARRSLQSMIAISVSFMLTKALQANGEKHMVHRRCGGPLTRRLSVGSSRAELITTPFHSIAALGATPFHAQYGGPFAERGSESRACLCLEMEFVDKTMHHLCCCRVHERREEQWELEYVCVCLPERKAAGEGIR